MTIANHSTIPGYTFGSASPSPITEQDFALLKQTTLFGAEDERYLRLAGEVLSDQTEAILDVWYGFVGSHPHLLHYFSGADGQPIMEYLGRVRQRFAQWITDTCTRPYDRDWLNYQMEIAMRHHVRKNQTDQVASVPIIPLRYIVAFIVPITLTIRPFLEKKGHSAEDVEGMYQAWFKSLTLQVTLWSYPFVRDGQF